MAVRTKMTPAGSGKANGRSKSQWTRDLLDEGKSVAEITRIIPNMGYAFAYGIAKRAGKTDTAANRRSVRTVSLDRAAGLVRIQTEVGLRVVNLKTGKMTLK